MAKKSRKSAAKSKAKKTKAKKAKAKKAKVVRSKAKKKTKAAAKKKKKTARKAAKPGIISRTLHTMVDVIEETGQLRQKLEPPGTVES